MSREVWVRLEGALTETPDVVSNWAIGQPKEDALDCLQFAKELAQDYGTEMQIYGAACESIKGQRAVQRWLYAHGLSGFGWVTHIQEPPEGAEVIDQWPMSTKSPSGTTSEAETTNS